MSSNVDICNISATGALIKNNKNLKCGKKTDIMLKFDDVEITVKAKVINIDNDKASVVFLDMPKNISNKIIYC